MRSRELQTKEKQKATDKGEAIEAEISQAVAEPMEDRQQATVGSTGERQGEEEEALEAEVPLVRKRRSLTKAGEAKPVKERVAAQSTRPRREEAD